MLSRHPITGHRFGLPHPHTLQLPWLKLRPQKVPHGASTLTACARGIANTTRIARLLVVAMPCIRPEKSKSPRNEFLISMFPLCALIRRLRSRITVEFVLVEFKCLVEAYLVVVSSQDRHLLAMVVCIPRTGEDIYSALQKARNPTRMLFESLSSLIRLHLMILSCKVAHAICLQLRKGFRLFFCLRHHFQNRSAQEIARRQRMSSSFLTSPRTTIGRHPASARHVKLYKYTHQFSTLSILLSCPDVILMHKFTNCSR
jgi:hypothetical protein